jgi:hypothetical protein
MVAGGFPAIRVFQWDTTELASPVGNRTVPGGEFAFVRIVSSGCSTSSPNSPATTSGVLNFPGVVYDLTEPTFPSEVASTPVAITFNLAASGTAISDMRLYLSDDSAFQGSADEGLERAFMQYAPSGSLWLGGLSLPSGSVERIPQTVPGSPNVYRQDGGNALVGQDDQNSSEFIYLNVVVPLGTPFGQYGVCGSGLLRLSLIFNYWNNDFILQFGDLG